MAAIPKITNLHGTKSFASFVGIGWVGRWISRSVVTCDFAFYSAFLVFNFICRLCSFNFNNVLMCMLMKTINHSQTQIQPWVRFTKFRINLS